MSMHQPSLPLHRAFVVQVHADAAVVQGEVWGRVEHIRSGQATHFQSVAELVYFMVGVNPTLQMAARMAGVLGDLTIVGLGGYPTRQCC